MCTVVILRQPGHAWPVILAANRDEMLNRSWKPPARHWPDRPEVVAGLDELAGGTWMGLNDHGVLACILNRHGSLGPAPGKRSRGELVLEALDHADAADAVRALRDIDPAAYRPFNMVITDNRDAFWLVLTAEAEKAGHGVRTEPIPAGLSMLTAGDRNDLKDARIAAYLPRFQAAPAPAPNDDHWESWKNLLGASDARGDAHTAMSFRLADGFGTSSSSLVGLPSADGALAPNKARPKWLFAAGPPESTPFLPVDILGAAPLASR